MHKRSDPDLTASSRASRSDTEPAGVTTAAATGTASGAGDGVAVSDFRINLALQHFCAAAYFSRQVARLEDAHAGEGPGNFFFEELFHHAVACLFGAAAGLEAYTNELFANRQQLLPNHDPVILNHLWRLVGKQEVRDKLDLMLELRHRTKLDRSNHYLKNYAIVVRMRNAMIHFKPSSNSDRSEHFNISELLSGKFDLSPFIPEHRAFPLGWATHGGTKWIVESALGFIAEFERSAGLSPGPYTGAGSRLQP